MRALMRSRNTAFKMDLVGVHPQRVRRVACPTMRKMLTATRDHIGQRSGLNEDRAAWCDSSIKDLFGPLALVGVELHRNFIVPMAVGE